jgi:hypothetical protein
MSLDGGGKSTQVTTQSTEPPKYIQPYLNQGLEASQNLYEAGPAKYYPGQTVVGFSPETEDALGMVSDRARAGSPVLSNANTFASNTLGGGGTPSFGMGSNPYASSVYTPSQGYIGPINPYASSAYQAPGQNPYASPVATGGANPYSASAYQAPGGPNPYASPVSTGNANPYAANTYSEAANNFGAASNPALDAMFNKAADSTQTRLATEFAGGGRNIGASQPARAEELENLATNIYGGAYENERNRELEATQSAAGRGLSAYLQGQQIGATGYESAQGRALESGLSAQNIGAQSYEAERGRQQEAGLLGQQIGAQGYESAQARALQSGLAAQGIGAQGFEAERARQQEAGLLGQQIGANSFEANQGRTFDAAEAERQRQQQASLAGQQIGASGYEAERDRMAQEQAQQRQLQLGVLGLAPQLSEAYYSDAYRLAKVGAAREDLTGRQYQDEAARYDFEQNAPQTTLDQYLARINAMPGSVSTSQTPIYRNQAAGGLGGALAGYNLGSDFGYGGWGALLGGLLGAYGG